MKQCPNHSFASGSGKLHRQERGKEGGGLEVQAEALLSLATGRLSSGVSDLGTDSQGSEWVAVPGTYKMDYSLTNVMG